MKKQQHIPIKEMFQGDALRLALLALSIDLQYGDAQKTEFIMARIGETLSMHASRRSQLPAVIAALSYWMGAVLVAFEQGGDPISPKRIKSFKWFEHGRN